MTSTWGEENKGRNVQIRGSVNYGYIHLGIETKKKIIELVITLGKKGPKGPWLGPESNLQISFLFILDMFAKFHPNQTNRSRIIIRKQAATDK